MSKYRLTYGLDVRRGISGAELYVKIFQIISILPLPYIFIAPVYMGILHSKNIFSVLFDLGMAAVTRAEAFLLSYLYGSTGSECIVYFILPGVALILGIFAGNILKGNESLSLKVHYAAAALISLDLLIRLIPIYANIAFGLPAEISGFIIRSLCLYLVIKDIRSAAR
ncbi:MAG: hypothetical protein IJH43_01010 [Mogibacterium sp.]|nr:hypothetical protein [Mogibacterium sp.]